MDTELLVHIKAPSKLTDDRRYISIAQGILDFEPINVVRVNADDNGCHFRKSSVAVHQHDKRNAIGPPVQDGLSSTLRTSFKTIKPSCNALAKGQKQRNGNRNELRKAIPVSSSTVATPKPDNPPYKNPVRKQLVPQTSYLQTCATPDAGIPTKVQLFQEQIVVPNTEQNSRKRTWPEAFMASSDTMVVFNSQPTPSTRIPDSFVADQSSPSNQSAVMVDNRIDQNSANHTMDYPEETRNVQDSNGGAENTHSQELTAYNDPDSSRASMCSNQNDKNPDQVFLKIMDNHDETPKMPGRENTLIVPIPSTLCSVVSNRSENWRHLEDITIPSPPNGESAIGRRRANIELLLSNSRTCTTDNQSARTATSTNTSQRQTFLKLQASPVFIQAPSPKIGQHYVAAVELPSLRVTADAFDLPNQFKPEMMTRSIAAGERGYWMVPIHIWTEAKASATRMRRIRTSQEVNPDPNWRPLFTHFKLTEDEFLHFWEELNDFVSSGKAGWGVSAMRRRFVAMAGENEIDDEAQLYLQVYCYGDAIAYIYAMLLVCSRLHILCRQLQWVSCLDESVVITMTGDLIRKGNLGRWTSYTNEQGQQFFTCQSNDSQESRDMEMDENV